MTAAADALRAAALREPPVAAVVLGSGLADLADRWELIAAADFADLPGLSAPTVAGHRGRAVLARCDGRPVLLFAGRLHYYEGHPWERVAAPIRLAADLGARVLILTNAAGGIRPDLSPGTLMLVRDHMAWNRPHFWRQPGTGGVGGTRPSPYDSALGEVVRAAASAAGVTLAEGVYASVTGPCYETPAEIRAMRAAGADAVGMSTAHEAETGRELGMRVAAVSLITNPAAGTSEGPLNHAEVLQAAREAAGRLTAVVAEVLRRVSQAESRNS